MSESDPLFARFGLTSPAGDILFREGERGDVMYVIREGSVRIRKDSHDGDAESHTKTLAVLGPGEFFGEMSILNDKPRSATAEVVEDAKLLVLNSRTFEQMVKGNAEIAIRLIKKLSQRLDAANELIEVLVHRDARARVILGLARQVELVGEAVDGGIFVPLDRETLSEEVGVEIREANETLVRLGRLRIAEETTDDTGRVGFLVHDVHRLREFLQFLEMRQRYTE